MLHQSIVTLTFTFLFCTYSQADTLINICNRNVIGHLIADAAGATSCKEVSVEKMAQIKVLSMNMYNTYYFSAHPDSFARLTSLKELYLKLHALLPEHLFRGLSNLETLSLRTNSSPLPDKLLQNLPSLKYFNLEDSNATKISEDFFKGTNSLREVTIQDTDIEDIPEKLFQNMPNLNHLAIVGNKRWKQLHPNTFKNMPQLRFLFLVDGLLPRINGDAFRDLRLIEWLSLGSMQIKDLPADLFQGLTKLTYLSLNNNHLETLPPGIFDESDPYEIELAGNLFKSVPKGVFTGLRLAELELSDNQITSLETDTFSNSEIWKLHLPKNPISQLAPNSFRGISKLKELYLWNTPITEVSREHLGVDETTKIFGVTIKP